MSVICVNRDIALIAPEGIWWCSYSVLLFIQSRCSHYAAPISPLGHHGPHLHHYTPSEQPIHIRCSMVGSSVVLVCVLSLIASSSARWLCWVARPEGVPTDDATRDHRRHTRWLHAVRDNHALRCSFVEVGLCVVLRLVVPICCTHCRESVSVESFTSMFGMAVERAACLCWTYCQRYL